MGRKNRQTKILYFELCLCEDFAIENHLLDRTIALKRLAMLKIALTCFVSIVALLYMVDSVNM